MCCNDSGLRIEDRNENHQNGQAIMINSSDLSNQSNGILNRGKFIILEIAGA